MWEWILGGLGVIMLVSKRPRLLGGRNDQFVAIGLIVFALFMGGVFDGASFEQSSAGSITTVTLAAGKMNDSTTGISVNGDNNQQYDVAIADATLPDQALFEANVTVVRTDASKAGSFAASCSAPDHRNPSDSSDANLYNIVDKDTAGKLKCYINDVQGQSVVAFQEGVATAVVELSYRQDESGLDKTNQYDTRTVTFNIGGEAVTVETTRLEAAS